MSRTGDRFVHQAVGACVADVFRALFAHRKIGHNRFLPNPAQFNPVQSIIIPPIIILRYVIYEVDTAH
jgi:hypothetical protein